MPEVYHATIKFFSIQCLSASGGFRIQERACPRPGSDTRSGTKSTKGERKKPLIHILLRVLRVLRGEIPFVIYSPPGG